MINYVFDVDGTLTLPRRKIDPKFEDWFQHFLICSWVEKNNVYLVTGSDKNKTIEQLGKDLWSKVVSYQCAGNEAWYDNKRIYFSPWDCKNMVSFIEDFVLPQSKTPVKVGNHIEVRTGMINVSPVGRNATLKQRKEFYEWDKIHGERQQLANFINQRISGVRASIGGEISIDVVRKGKDKGQVFDFLQDLGPIYFFGDKTKEGGNDYALASRLTEYPHKVFQVSGPEEVKSILEGLE